jgi:hypothetical protein
VLLRSSLEGSERASGRAREVFSAAVVSEVADQLSNRALRLRDLRRRLRLRLRACRCGDRARGGRGAGCAPPPVACASGRRVAVPLCRCSAARPPAGRDLVFAAFVAPGGASSRVLLGRPPQAENPVERDRRGAAAAPRRLVPCGSGGVLWVCSGAALRLASPRLAWQELRATSMRLWRGSRGCCLRVPVEERREKREER